MKKYLAILLAFVFVLTCGITVYAGGGMVGQAIDSQYPLWLRGNKLSKDAIVINGVSYIPVRMVGEALGLDVQFKDNQIYLNNKGSKTLPIYKVKSNLFTVGNQPDFYTVKDGEWYYPIGVFSNDWEPLAGHVKYNSKNNLVTFTMPWGEFAFAKADSYTVGVPCYTENNRALVSLSSLGLKPVIKGDEAWLEKI